MKLQIVSAVLLALCALTQTTSGEVKVVRPNDECMCEEIFSSTCALHFNTGVWYGRFPNTRGQEKSDAIDEFFDFKLLLDLDNYCSHMLYNLLCFHYFPQCDPNSPGLAATPCRETCNEALTSCIDHARAIQANYTFPAHLNCSNFPSGSSEGCANTQCTACPNASIHLEFATEAVWTGFGCSESNGSAYICIRLANVGSYESNATLQENVTVHLCPMSVSSDPLSHKYENQNSTCLDRSAEAELDFSKIEFPIGSEKGKVLCTTVDIIRDYQNMCSEHFKVFASIISPEGAKFGGDIASSTSSVTLTAADQYKPHPDRNPVIPDTECRNSKCKWRSSISRNTFTSNRYLFTARVIVCRCTTTTLEVCMLECYDSTDGLCPQTPSCTKLAICPSCVPDTCPVGKEVIVAGGHSDSGSLFISDYRKKGLFNSSSGQNTLWLMFIPDNWKQ